jgi:hypothetical protein
MRPFEKTPAGSIPPGRPLFVVGVTALFEACEGHGEGGVQPQALVRLTESGQPDPTFGAGTGISPIVGAGKTRPLFLGLAEGDQPPLNTFGPEGAREFVAAHAELVEPSGTTILTAYRGRRTSPLTGSGRSPKSL